MHVRHHLAGGYAICQIQVDFLALGDTPSEHPGDVLRDSEHLRARFFVEFRQGCSVHDGNNQHVPWEFALADIHKGAATVIPEHDARGAFARQDVAKGARGHHITSA